MMTRDELAFRFTRRGILLAALALSVGAGCAGAISELKTQTKPTGSGPARLEVENGSSESLHGAYVARTADVDASVEAGTAPGSAEDVELWGEDLLGLDQIAPGSRFTVGELAPDRYDLLVVDGNGREQLVKGLKLKAGGAYVLRLGDRWQHAR